MQKVRLADLVSRSLRAERQQEGQPDRTELGEAVARLFTETWPEVPFKQHLTAAIEMVEMYEAEMHCARLEAEGQFSVGRSSR